MICLDTNAAIAAINRRAPEVRRRLEVTIAQGVDIGIPAIALFELHYGIAKSARPFENAMILDTFLALGMSLWPFEPEDAGEAGEIRAALERAGTPIGPYDVLIAAQARRRNAILVTANTGEFDRVPGLKIQNWAIV
ncbi:type II toxin-antitoxin system VapC family toxin [Inquilinus sp. CAU 1745]|uniref:type II toxin-antitoxin system VapC family toxin n=1 Tax=Inquilinus sp. CAU 1745 TaxID=3140369 RepID=UPI00325A47CA